MHIEIINSWIPVRFGSPAHEQIHPWVRFSVPISEEMSMRTLMGRRVIMMISFKMLINYTNLFKISKHNLIYLFSPGCFYIEYPFHYQLIKILFSQGNTLLGWSSTYPTLSKDFFFIS